MHHGALASACNSEAASQTLAKIENHTAAADYSAIKGINSVVLIQKLQRMVQK